MLTAKDILRRVAPKQSIALGTGRGAPLWIAKLLADAMKGFTSFHVMDIESCWKPALGWFAL